MRVVILGTGTDVGKTYVTAVIARGLSQHTDVLALKPIESGVDPGVTGDAGTIAAAAGHEPVLSPWRFCRPVSPHLAARESGAVLTLPEVESWVGAQEREHPRAITLVELAGGAFSPLGVNITNADLALALEPAIWLLVAPDALGVLHDVTATLRALPHPPDALLLSASRAPDQSTGSNARELEALGISSVLEVIGRSGAAPSTVEWLLDHPSRKSR